MESLYTKLGGDGAIEEIVEVLYRNVLADEKLAPFFDGIDMSHQQRKFRMFLHVIVGGPQRISDLELRAAHAKVVSKGAAEAHVGYLLGHLRSAMEDRKLDPAMVEQVLARVEAHTDDALGR